MTDSYSGLHDPYEDQLAAARYRAERDQAREELARIREDRSWDARADAGMLGAKEDRRAVEWVREHGGLERVKGLLDWVVGHCSTRQQLDFDFWLSGRVMHELGFEGDVADRDEVERRLLARIMPEGMEWPKVEGEPVVIGERLVGYGSGGDGYEVVGVRPTCGWVVVKSYDHVTRDEAPVILEWDASKCQRPAPKVLDAVVAEIRVGDECYVASNGDGPYVVYHIREADGAIDMHWHENRNESLHIRPDLITHRAPVLAADGKPLREGETVYHVADGRAYVVREVREDGAVVEPVDGRLCGRCRADYLTHERPDSWERLEEDAGKNPFDYCKDVGHRLDTCESSEAYKARDLVRRARALAERGQ